MLVPCPSQKDTAADSWEVGEKALCSCLDLPRVELHHTELGQGGGRRK